MTDLKAAYQECQRITRREARSFNYDSVLIPSMRRRAIYVAYAFCRQCHDIVDFESTNYEKLRRLAELRNLLDCIEEADYNVFSHRVSLSTGEKLALVAQSWAGSMWPRCTPGSV